MRIQNSIKNIIFGLGGQLASTILAFITRTVFIYVLGAEYLGIDGLFTNVLSLLSLANLGFDSAIIFSLYKPLSDKNNVEIKGYIGIYSVVYKFVGTFVFFIGILLIPFLPYIISGELNIKENLTVIYIMFLLNSSISYFYIYKQSILIANQQNYIISKVHTLFMLLSNVLQIVVLLISKNYLLMLGIQLICRVLENIYISKCADKEFPFLKDKKIEGKLSKEKKRSLYKNVYSMLLYKISGTVINSTDNIIISYFVGIFYVGIYSNYLLIISTLRTLLSYIFSSLKASVGNLMVSKDNEKKEFIYYEIFFLSFWIYGFLSICLFILLNDFITIWIGEKYVLDTFTVLIIIVNFYTEGMQNVSTTYRDTTGLFSVGKYRPIIAAIINIIVSIILAPKLKISGILLGTIISRVLVYFWFDPYVIHKYVFKKRIMSYFIEYIKKVFIIVATGNITFLVTKTIIVESLFLRFFINCGICILVPNVIFLTIFYKNKYFKYLNNIFRTFIKIK
ncbi:sugar translocase [Clostridium sp.]|uniref:lipopolysaccharide biosynthesis protein n=1 Tax=Clostridium sp. TaxID=1506 RepID=UPI0032172310